MAFWFFFFCACIAFGLTLFLCRKRGSTFSDLSVAGGQIRKKLGNGFPHPVCHDVLLLMGALMDVDLEKHPKVCMPHLAADAVERAASLACHRAVSGAGGVPGRALGGMTTSRLLPSVLVLVR